MSTESIKLLQQMPVFGGLSKQALQLTIDSSDFVNVDANDYFFHEGDKAKSMFVLQSGEVVVEKIWHGTPVVLGHLNKGDCFGEMALIDLQPRSASVKAKIDCTALEISLRALSELHQHELEQYAIIMMNMGREVSRRLRIADTQLFELRQEQDSPDV